jgi:predicted metal-dependent hydrolase
MPAKIFDLDGVGPIHIYKRHGSRSIRLGFGQSGEVRVSIPYWVPYGAGLNFAKERTAWIGQHRPEKRGLFKHADKIGKAHHLSFLPDQKVKTAQVRLKLGQIIVKYPDLLSFEDPIVQKAAERGAKKALWEEAERLLPGRLALLADQHSFRYKNITVKQLKSKWGSCNHHNEITLNYYLMQLPWNLIDYVLVHELVHTEHLNHSVAFWERFEEALPGAKKMRKELKTYKTAVIPN